MLARIRKSAEEKDQGFTLIELLVVIIIIGILAAIAIPVFLNQRKKGWDAQAKSDLKNMATAEETYLTDNNVYTALLGDLKSEGFNPSADTTGQTATPTGTGNADGYCLTADSKSGITWYYGSDTGTPAQTASPAC
jgi:type IV pilus assembly protein PilA